MDNATLYIKYCVLVFFLTGFVNNELNAQSQRYSIEKEHKKRRMSIAEYSKMKTGQLKEQKKRRKERREERKASRQTKRLSYAKQHKQVQKRMKSNKKKADRYNGNKIPLKEKIRKLLHIKKKKLNTVTPT